jgi:uncharacterized membrane protein YkvI
MFSPHAVVTGPSPSELPARLTTLLLLLIVVVSAAGCAAIGGIFKAGVWAGVIMAVLVIAVVFFLVRSVSR